MPKAKAAAVRAVELDDKLAEAHASLAVVKFFYDWDWPGAEREFRRALELNPHYVGGRPWYIFGLAAMGRYEEVGAAVERALESDRLSLAILVGCGYSFYLARQYDRALEQAQACLELDSNFYQAHYLLGSVYEQQGRLDDAIAELQMAVTLSNGVPLMRGALGHAYAIAGRRDEALEQLQQLASRTGGSYIPSFNIAMIHTGLGEVELAFQFLQRACEERAIWLIFLGAHPVFDVLRPDPRFEVLLSRIGLAPINAGKPSTS